MAKENRRPGDDLPNFVTVLLWDTEPAQIDLGKHSAYVMERVMTRGTWDAMRWLRRTYAREELAAFLARHGNRIPPRDRAYWSLIVGERDQAPGGGRPHWAG